MAITITKTENEWGYSSRNAFATHTFRVDIGDIVVNDANDQTLNNYVTTPASGYGKYNTSADSRARLYQKFYFKFYINDTYIRRARYTNYSASYTAVSANVEAPIPRTNFWWNTEVKPSDYFNSSNKTTSFVPITYTLEEFECETLTSDVTTVARIYSNTESGALGTINLRLNVPPTFDNTALSIDTATAYTNITTASVTVSNATAYYGGDIASATLTIGNQTASATSDGTLSVLLDTVGTFTPTITATDSRGQTTTVTLDPIEVKGYTAPAVTFTADRTLQTGVEDDEGGYATVDATFTYTDVVADLVAPSVVLTDENGTQTTPTVTWYKTRATDGTLSNPFTDWTTVAYGDTVYGLIPGLSTQYSYQVSIRPRDTQGTGTAIIQTIAPAFYTVDFLAGGHGIAFGKPASQAGFECAMEATFDDAATFGSDIYIDLSDYQTAGSVDKELYDAIVALGWDSDVLVN